MQNRGTIKAIQSECRKVYGFVPQSCEIAEGKERQGHPVDQSWNRGSGPRQKVRPAKMPMVDQSLAKMGW